MRSMGRDPFFGVPASRLAVWSGRLGIFALIVAVLSIIIVRSGFLEIGPALATFAASLIFSGLAILLALAAFVVIWRKGYAGLGRAVSGLLLGIALLAYPGYLAYRGTKLPAIDDVTTDPGNPPRFEALARLRPRDRIQYPGARVAALQNKAYPDLDTLEYTAPPALAYQVALKIVKERNWRIVNEVPPAAGVRDGIIEAVARTLIMGFRDDVVVRVRAGQQGSLIDVRSASRYGVGDFGTNARRVASLLGDIDDAMTAAMTEPAHAGTKRIPQAPKRPKR
jgi:uncharacterized protein (DUF1499 family)